LDSQNKFYKLTLHEEYKTRIILFKAKNDNLVENKDNSFRNKYI